MNISNFKPGLLKIKTEKKKIKMEDTVYICSVCNSNDLEYSIDPRDMGQNWCKFCGSSDAEQNRIRVLKSEWERDNGPIEQ